MDSSFSDPLSPLILVDGISDSFCFLVGVHSGQIFLMHVLVAVLLSVAFAASCWGANLRVDASKNVEPQSLRLKKLNTQKNSFLQQKRFSTKLLKQAESPYQGKKISPSKTNASNSISKLSQMDARIGQKDASRQPRLLDQVIKASDALEKTYNEALTLELSKRAANQVEKPKIKKNKASQSDINRDAKVRSQIEDGFKIQRAGQKAN